MSRTGLDGPMTAPAGLDLDWAIRSGGALTTGEKLRLLTALGPVLLRYPVARLRLATGRRGSASLDLDAVDFPDSRLARDAEDELARTCAPHVVAHCYRTYLWGRVLAQVTGAHVDEETAFVAAMLHDLNLEHPTPGRCFAVVGAQAAQGFVLDHGGTPDLARAVAAGVAGHLTPGVAGDLSTTAGFVSAGALADVTGFGLERVDGSWADRVHARYPRQDLRRHLLAAFRQEARLVPDGRTRWLIRYASFGVLVRIAPFPE